MPVSLTKNKQSDAVIREMLHRAFPFVIPLEIEELTEGFFNVAYYVKLEDGREVILKIAPPPESLIMTHEKNIMFAEVDSMRRVEHDTDVPVAKILYYDDTHELCKADYFVMEKLGGKSFFSCMEHMTQEEKDTIWEQLGLQNAKLNAICGTTFGYYAQPDRQGNDWFEVFSHILHDPFKDARHPFEDGRLIDMKIPEEELFILLAQDKEIFKEVTIPQFVHWDLWAGNVFVREGRLTGLIDFERCLWGDPLMECSFRTYGCEPAFLKGYGKKELTPREYRRALWYDAYLFLINMLECDYRNYETYDYYNWASDMLLKTIQKLKQR